MTTLPAHEDGLSDSSPVRAAADGLDAVEAAVARAPRRHDLDALRAFAMLLGIALHAALSFMEVPWIVQDREQSAGFGVFISVVHGFRMQLFFMLSGFFTAMLWQSRGLRALLKQRALRIALPLAIGCVTIVPVMWMLLVGIALAGGPAASSTDADGAPADIWTAAAVGDVAALGPLIEAGAELDAPDPTAGMTPLGWAVTWDRANAVTMLLDAGAAPSGRYRDRNTPLHTAAFFGRPEIAGLLVAAGADVDARNTQGETPRDSLRHDQGTTAFIAGVLRLPIDFEEVRVGREGVSSLLDERGALVTPPRGIGKRIVAGLMEFPFFHHLWFLWYLCWFVVGFAIVVTVLGVLPRIPVPTILVATPLCLLWLLPVTMVPQSWMGTFGPSALLGADTSAGLIPVPHVLVYYAVFFAFGALLFTRTGAVDRLGRGWWILLPVGLLLAPIALAVGAGSESVRALVPDEDTRRFVSNLLQVVFAWTMIFGLLGLFETVLRRERAWVRYLSDASYWMYLVHLPIILLLQALVRSMPLPAIVKFTLILAICTPILLVTYRYLVRYTWIGLVLNGRRARPGATAANG